MSIATIGMKDLLEAGVHFGHNSSNWDPKMKKFIFMKRKGVHIIDLQKTLTLAEQAHNYVKNVIANGGKILFVGTKKQAKQSVKEAAIECDQYYITQRWIGGLLTNFKTIQSSLKRLNALEKILSDKNILAEYSKKQISLINKNKERLEGLFGGIKKMTALPALIFVVDAKHENIAIGEANKAGIPVAALVDTNSNPDNIDVVIPGNDDAIRAISLFIDYMADAVKQGLALLPGEDSQKIDSTESKLPETQPEEISTEEEASKESAEERSTETDQTDIKEEDTLSEKDSSQSEEESKEENN